MTDILEQLEMFPDVKLCCVAAEEIKRLRGRLAMADEALRVKEQLNETLRRELDAAHAELRDLTSDDGK